MKHRSVEFIVFLLLPALGAGAVYFITLSLGVPPWLRYTAPAVLALLLVFHASKYYSEFSTAEARKSPPLVRQPHEFLSWFLTAYAVTVASMGGAYWAAVWLLRRNPDFLSPDQRPFAPYVAAGVVGYALFKAGRDFWAPQANGRLQGMELLDQKKGAAVADAVRPKDDPGIPIGGADLPTEVAPTHTVYIGAPGSGKSLQIRLAQQRALPRIGLGHGDRAMIYDAKTETLGFLAGMGLHCPVYSLHPFDCRGAAWDMAEIDDIGTAREIATIFIPEQQGPNRYFDDAGRDILSGLMISYMCNASGVWTLRDILLGMRDEKRLREVLGRCPLTKHLIDLYFEPRGTFQNIRSTIATRLELFEPVAAAWHHAKTKIRLSDWADGEFILILGNDHARRTAIQPINRIFLKRGYQLVLAKPDNPPGISWFFEDEFTDLGKQEDIDKILAEGRSKNAAVVLGIQAIEAVWQHYGKDGGNALLAQVSQKVMGRSASDTTATWQSAHFGDVIVTEDEESINYGQRTTVTRARRTSTRKLLVPAEFLKIPRTTRKNGLTTYNLSPAVGAWHSHLSGEYLARALKAPGNVPNFTPRPKDELVLTPWTDADLQRLGLDPYGRSVPTVLLGSAPHGVGPNIHVTVEKNGSFRGAPRKGRRR